MTRDHARPHRAERRLDCGICALVFGCMFALIGLSGGLWWPTYGVGLCGCVLLLVGVMCVAPPDLQAGASRDERPDADTTESAETKPSVDHPT